MRTLYFDCFAGASGDMLLGALVDAGVDSIQLKEQLSLLGVTGYEVDFSRVNRAGISATRARVQTQPESKSRHLSDILKIIYDSRLRDQIKERAAQIFSRLAEAEARVHDEAVERIHFHEVGALDAIVDVVGACVCFDLLGVERFVCSKLHVGSGTVEMAHGRFPVPPPAVAELLKGAPVYATDIVGELVTPTGAAVISTLCSEYGALPEMKIEQTGYGAGAREYENFPNVLRVMLGEDETDERATDERLLVIETNIDDMSPEIFGFVMERAFEQGALDCYFTPVQMKKNRPGALVSILCRHTEREAMYNLLLMETTTLGVRSYEVERRALEREIVRVETVYGPVDVKVARMNGRVIKAMAEYEQCRAIALKENVALRAIEEAARSAFGKTVSQEARKM